MLITLEDGRVFPAYNGEPLAWSEGGYLTWAEEKIGYPRARAVLLELSDDELAKRRSETLRDSLGRMFGHNAEKHLALIEDEIARRAGAKKSRGRGVSGLGSRKKSGRKSKRRSGRK